MAGKAVAMRSGRSRKRAPRKNCQTYSAKLRQARAPRTVVSTLELVHSDHAEDFFHGGLAGGDAGDSVLPEGAHALFDGDLLEGAGGQLLEHGIAEDFVGNDEFGDGAAAGEAGLQAFLAAGSTDRKSVV